MRRYELSDPQWARIAPLLPHRTHHHQAGHPFNDPRPLVNGILWILHTGAPWRDLPERYGPWQTVFKCFNRWRQDGTWVRLVTSLLDELDDKGLIDHDLWCIDSSVIRASRAAAGAKKKGVRPPKGWAGAKKRNYRNHLIMRSDVRAAALGQKSIWFVTATVSLLPFTSRRGSATRVSSSNQRWLDVCSIAVGGKGAGHAAWRGTRATVTRASGAGVNAAALRQSSRRGRTKHATRRSTR
jgi:transposase